jgi:hypothetical protein
MDAQSEKTGEARSEPIETRLDPLDDLETDEVPDSMISVFSSLTTPYCWVITEDAVADARADLGQSQWSARSDLSGAYRQCADLAGANFRGANLSDVDLSGADVQGADIAGRTSTARS